MIKTWRVGWQEYRERVLNRRYLLALLSVPFLIAVMIGLIYLIIALGSDNRPVGYVDHSGLLSDPVPAPPVEPPERPVQFLAFADENGARAALNAGQIQSYYVLPQDYRTTGRLEVVHIAPLKSARYQFYNFLSANLLKNLDPAVAQRAIHSTEVIVESADGSRQMSLQNWANILLPMFAGIAFMIAMFSTGGYLMHAVVEEKENRTMEVLITSVSADQFMAGKIGADIAAGLTQILVWGAFIAVALLFGGNALSLLKGIQVSSQVYVLALAVMLPSFVMFSALMAALGATVAEAREGQQVIGFISLPIWIPYMLTGLIMGSPNSPLVIGLSLFPFTGALTMLMRAGATIVPAWEILVCSAITLASAAGAIWLAGRTFRLGMLSYGKRLLWREVFARQGGKP